MTMGIDDPIDGSPAPLPTADAGDAPEGVQADAGKKSDPPAGTQPQVDDAKPVEAKPAEGQEPEAKQHDLELTPEENEIVKALPADQQSDAQSRFKKSRFMEHYLDPKKPAVEIHHHLRERSPSRFAQLEASILEERLADPDSFASALFQQSPETYSKIANAVFNGDPKYFTKQITGRDDVSAEQVKTALDFHDRNKDKVPDEVELSEIDEETLLEMEEYFPDKVPAIRAQMEAAQKLRDENQRLSDAKPKEAAVDPKQAEFQQQQDLAREVDGLWDVARDTVGEYVSGLAYDVEKGIGVHVTAEERKAAPLVAMLKDVKANIFFNGYDVDGKQLIGGFQQDLTAWAKDRPGFKDKITDLDTFTKAREKQNVVEVARGINPIAKLYYEERQRLPLFAQLDSLIALVAQRGSTAPKFDAQIPGHLPSTAGAAKSAANSEDWLVQDAVARA